MNTSSNLTQSLSPKSGAVTLILCMFLGNLGIHRFYVGKIGTGILMLLTFGVFGIWTIVDIVLIACGHFKDGNGQVIGFRKSNKSTSTIVSITLGIIIAIILLSFLVMRNVPVNPHTEVRVITGENPSPAR